MTSTHPTGPQYHQTKFYFDACPDRQYPAYSYGERWNGWATPSVDKATLTAMFEWSEEPYHWDGNAAVLEREDGDWKLEPDPDGHYDAASLGWTLCMVGDFADEVPQN
jgi:hypothetical protein